MTNPTFTPPPEMVEAAARALYDTDPFYLPIGQRREGVEMARSIPFDHAPAYRQEEVRIQARAAIAVLAPMIGEEAAKVAEGADEYPADETLTDKLNLFRAGRTRAAAAIRSKFATGEKGK